MHAHAHPLLAAWGRQSRDYVRQLDAFDTTGAAAQLQMPRVDLFDETDAEDLRTAPLLEGTAAHPRPGAAGRAPAAGGDRKSTRLNSSHSQISYAVFCLKKKKKKKPHIPVY